MRIIMLLGILCTLLSSIATFAQAQQGIEVADIDQKADPCTDFFQYSNGAWRANNPIPASMDRWSRRWAAGETNKEQLKVLLEEDAAKQNQPKGSIDQLVGDFYGACTELMARHQSVGRQPAQAVCLPRSATPSAPRWNVQAAIISLRDIGIQVPFALNSAP